MGMFGKKKERKEFELPPPPPPIGGELGSMELPDFPAPPPPPSVEMHEAELPPPPPPEFKLPELPSVHMDEEPEVEKLHEIETRAPRPEPVTVRRIIPAPTLQDFRPEPEFRPQMSRPPPPKIEESRPHMMPTRPIFVRSDRYQEIISSIGTVRSEMKQADDVMLRLDEIEKERGAQFTRWRNELEDVQRKLVFVDKTLFEG